MRSEVKEVGRCRPAGRGVRLRSPSCASCGFSVLGGGINCECEFRRCAGVYLCVTRCCLCECCGVASSIRTFECDETIKCWGMKDTVNVLANSHFLLLHALVGHEILGRAKDVVWSAVLVLMCGVGLRD